MKDTKIQWCHHTFNSWWGCQRVSPGCENCYAEAFAKRTGHDVWGRAAERRMFKPAHWLEPHRWNRAAAAAGERRRVFCASMADVFEDRSDLDEARSKLWLTIRETPWLDWLVLTKRPQNMARMLPSDWRTGYQNVWLGCTAEDQQRAGERIPHLLATPAEVRFVSAEPLLQGIDFRRIPANLDGAVGDMVDSLTGEQFAMEPGDCPDAPELPRIDWVIVGGESGPGARSFQVDWARSIVEQCRDAGAAVFVKQMGARVIERNDNGWSLGDEDPDEWPGHLVGEDRIEDNPNGCREEYQGAPVRLRLRDRKGGDPAEWPANLRIREFPR